MGCPDANTIASFIEGRLTETDRSSVAGHLESCEACFDLVAAALGRPPVGEGDSSRAGRPPLPTGTPIGRYMIVELVGRGGMGEVYAAYDPKLNRKIALKLLNERTSSPRSAARFSREAQAIARLSHPNVVAIYDAGDFEDRLFLAMEFIDGQTLAEWLRSAQRSWPEIRDVFAACGAGLAAAHEAGLVHRDFKPQNVMVGRDGSARVMDFGLATDSSGVEATEADAFDFATGGAEPTSHTLALTRTGVLLGTPLYMAPEQFLRQRADARSDQFSFSVALYEALYGAHPFAGGGLGELAAAVTEGRVRPPLPKSTVSPWLRRILLRGLAADPAGRWPSMNALIAALSRDPIRLRRRWLAGAASVALLAGAWSLRTTHRAEPICRGGPSRLAEAWELPGDAASPRPRRDAARAAFVKTGVEHAAETWEQAATMIDKYAGGWLRMYQDACEATHVRGEQSTQVLDLRMSCLSDRLARVKALADVFTAANPAVVENATNAASALPPLDRCADVESLRAVVPPPDDPNVRARVEVLKRDLARVRALGDSGQCATAAAAGRELVAAAEKLGYLPLLAESLNALGTPTGSECLPPEETLSVARRAALAGLTSQDEEAAAEGAIIVAHAEADRTSQIGEARIWMDFADALLSGMSHPPWKLQVLQREVRANLLEKEGDLEGAIDSLQHARPLIEKNEGLENTDYAALINSMGVMRVEQKRFVEGLAYYRQAGQIAARSSAGNSIAGLNLANQAEALNALARHEEARETAEHAYELFRRGDSAPYYRAFALTMLGEALNGMGRSAEAEVQLERAIELFGENRSLYPCEARFALARSLWSQPPKRALSLTRAHEARDRYLQLPDGKAKAAEVTTWLASRENARSHR